MTMMMVMRVTTVKVMMNLVVKILVMMMAHVVDDNGDDGVCFLDC